MCRDRFHLALLLFAVAGAYVVLSLGGGGSPPAHAGPGFMESSPGPLSLDHASLEGEGNCSKCHTNGKHLSNAKCLGCHDHHNLRDRIRAGKGFHASAKVRGKKCETCHTEHRGRRFNILGWQTIGGTSNFDHRLTGWALKGKHRAIQCASCHKKHDRQGLRTYIGLDPTCGSCHKKDSPHKSTRRRMMKCERCHTDSIWSMPKRHMDFDHNDPRDAAFPLVGSHRDVACEKCHPKAVFNLGHKHPGNCVHCHNDPHVGHLFGTKPCAWCHSPKYRRLKSIRFNHKRRTHFALIGKHASISCYACHTNRLGTRKPRRQCRSCHAKDNKHGQRFKEFGTPSKCGLCHASSSWKRPIIFNHDKYTQFKLTGKHAQVTCRKCHRGTTPAQFERFNPKTVRCMGCHEHKNVHNRQFTDIREVSKRPLDKNGKPEKYCLDCHKNPGIVVITKASIQRFHGPHSRFPLVKGHKGVKCVLCHKNDQYKNTPMECGVRCHEDSLHRGSLGNKCSRCHSPGTWKADRFDHTKDTKWPLKGFHKTIPDCADCHPERDYAHTPTTCGAIGCHGQDDVHKGKLGKKCGRCHREDGTNVFNHNTMSRFKLTGAHLTTRCVQCHPSITFRPRPTTCVGCHPEPAIHKGEFGTKCGRCHSTVTFKDIRPLHDVGDFSLRGAHDRLPCNRCHTSRLKSLAGTGNLCITCHRQDDVHNNSLSPRCGKCHTQWSFSPARFDHTTVGCILTGVHRTLPCYSCHRTGNFRGLSPTCYGCHRKDALKVPATIFPHAGLVECGSCHNTDSWLGAVGPSTGYGRESICR